jgi:hypothetical protein
VALSEFRIQGFKEIDRELKKMEKNLARQVLDSVMEKAAYPMMMRAQETAPVGSRERTYKRSKYQPGRLRASIYTQIKRWPHATVADVKPKVPYAWLVEYGHKIVRVNKKTGQRRVVGFARPTSFMRKAFDSSSAISLAILEKEIQRIIFK